MQQHRYKKCVRLFYPQFPTLYHLLDRIPCRSFNLVLLPPIF